jgi:hypothetical protein
MESTVAAQTKCLGFLSHVWPVCLAMVGAILMNYREV